MLGELRGVSVAAGAVHSLVATAEGAVFAFGRNEFGQLGCVAAGECAAEPVRVDPGPSMLGELKATRVACGYYFSLVITADGGLHGYALGGLLAGARGGGRN